ncbi:MAG: RHS repeat domain-containing protein, partial [Victivallales bacterium]
MKYLLNAVLLSIFTVTSLYASVQKTAAPTVKRKPILIVEYEYSKSGRITARKINGQVQNYKYDKKGQLLGVYDDKGNAIEEYVYDPAGNILKKTIQGKTTTYKYDKANQLVSSECNGKVTKYEYDAAGRLVKEGDKEY